MRSRLAWTLAVVVAMVAAPSCGSSGKNDFSNGGGDNDGGVGMLNPDGGLFTLGSGDGSVSIDGQILCEETCPSGLVCNHGFCLPPQGPCVSNAQCEDDTYCGSDGTCDPYGGSVTNDPNCSVSIPAGAFAPVDFCDFKPTATDPFATYVDVQSTPIVVNFNPVDPDGGLPTGAPSIIAPFTVPVAGGYTENMGVIRVLSGTDCSLQATLGGGSIITSFIRSSSTVSVGDLDGDDVAEIVAYTGDLSVVALTLKAGTWKPLWATSTANPDGLATSAGAIFVTPTPPSGTEWGGPSIHDLNNDGKPEIIVEGNVINGQTGALLAAAPADYASYCVGIPAVVANMNADTNAEMTNGAHLWKFDATTNTWTDVATLRRRRRPARAGPASPTSIRTTGSRQPEIAVAATDTLSVYTIDHAVFLGMSGIPVPGTGGGPPTIADYDGDGLPEVGLAGEDFYTVFDPDCQATPRPGGKCGRTGRTPATRASRARRPGTTMPRPGDDCPTTSYGRRRRRTTRPTSPAARSSTSRRRAAPRSSTPTSASRASSRARTGRCCSRSTTRRARGSRTPSSPTSTATSTPSSSSCRTRPAARRRRASTAAGRSTRNGVDATFAGEQCQTGHRLRLRRLRLAATAAARRRRVLRRDDRRGVPRGRARVRPPSRGHAGDRQHLPRSAPARAAGHPRVQGRAEPVGPLADDLEPARLRRHQRQRGRHRRRRRARGRRTGRRPG